MTLGNLSIFNSNELSANSMDEVTWTFTSKGKTTNKQVKCFSNLKLHKTFFVFYLPPLATHQKVSSGTLKIKGG